MREIIIRMKSGNDLIKENKLAGKEALFDFEPRRLLEVELDGVVYKDLLGADIKIGTPSTWTRHGEKGHPWTLDINLKHYMKSAEKN